MSVVPPATSSLLARLRHETAALHARVEDALPLLDAGLTRDAYRRVLAAFLGYYRPLEPALWCVPGLDALGLHERERRKTPLLERDLRALGADDASLAALPDCPRLPDPRASLPRTLGCLYVLEGATLGGRVITRHLSRTLGVDPSRGGAFFASYGDRVGAMWTAYRAAAGRHAADAGGEDEIVDAAVETFETMGEWIGERGARSA